MHEFAEIGANDWVVIIAAIGVVASNVIAAIGLAIVQVIAARRASEKVEAVRTDLKATTEDHGKKLDTIQKQVEEVHTATNGMKDQLVKVTGESEHAKGLLEGKATIDPRNVRGESS